MPVFTPQDIKEIEVANRIKAVLLSIHLELKQPQPKTITASYDFETGELGYDIIPVDPSPTI